MLDDKRLVQQMQRGEAAAFTEFVDRFGGRVLALARRHTRCEADAEDLTQEVLVALCRGIGKFRGESALSTYVYRVTLNQCLKFRSRRSPESVPLEDVVVENKEPSPAEQVAQTELKAQLAGALAQLGESHRDVVILHEMHGLTYAECADVLGVPVGTVKSRLFHAFGKLRGLLRSYVHGDEEANTTPAAVVGTSLPQGRR